MFTRQPDPPSLAAAATVIAALDSPLRLEILLRLHERTHVVHELVSHLGKSQPLISQHLRVLKRAGLVESRRSGREVSYRLVSLDTIEIIESAARLGEKVNQRQEQQDDLAARRRSRRGREANPPVSGASVSKAAIVDPPPSVHEDMPGLVPAPPESPSPTSK